MSCEYKASAAPAPMGRLRALVEQGAHVAGEEGGSEGLLQVGDGGGAARRPASRISTIGLPVGGAQPRSGAGVALTARPPLSGRLCRDGGRRRPRGSSPTPTLSRLG